MTRFAIDARTALKIIDDERPLPASHSLVGPGLLRSDALALLHDAVRGGTLHPDLGRERLERIAGLKIRLLGDRVSRATAWKLADRLDGDTRRAEYLAVASLQADALITDDPVLIAAAETVVPLAAYEALFVRSG